jgi:disulfide bond formation protein DsbB
MPILFQPRIAFLLTLLVSIGALGAAYVAQFVFHLKPCELCLWQRAPYALLILWSSAALFVTLHFPKSTLIFLAILTVFFLASAGTAFFHLGVEQHWWSLEQGCRVPELSGKTEAELLAEILATPMAKCDEVTWSFLGLSITLWNTALSAVMAVYLSLVVMRKHAP